MKNLSLFLAIRYLRGTRQEKNISVMVKVCFLGIAIGSFSLALVLAVMNGFEKTTHEKMQGINATLIMRAQGNYLHLKALRPLLDQHPAIAAWTPSETKQVIVQNRANDSTEIMVLKGIDPRLEAKTTVLEHKLIDGPPTLTAALQDNAIVLGVKAAELLGVTVGDQLELLFTPHEPTGRKITLDSTPVVVGALFKTGIDDLDAGVLYCSLHFMIATFPEAGISSIGIKLKPDASEEAVIASLKEQAGGIEIFSWKDLYLPLVSALKLEKYVMFLLLALITLVASMNIISLLFMQITQKRGDIAILQALGCPTAAVRSIFLYAGLLISAAASLVGLTLATIVCWLLERYPFIELPDVYYVTHLPAKMELSLLILVFVVVNGLSFLATWLPAQRVGNINIANVLRFEG